MLSVQLREGEEAGEASALRADIEGGACSQTCHQADGACIGAALSFLKALGEDDLSVCYLLVLVYVGRVQRNVSVLHF